MKQDSRQQPTRRLHIKRLEVDLRGVAPTTAETSVRLLGPALTRALVGHRINEASVGKIDAGCIRLASVVDAGTLSRQLARRIAGVMSGG